MDKNSVFDFILNSPGVFVDFTKEERAIVEKFVTERCDSGNLSDFIRAVVLAEIEDCKVADKALEEHRQSDGKTYTQDEVEEMILRTDGSMSLSDMPLTDDDKDRIRQNAFDKDKAEQTVSELVEKHTKGE